MRSPCKILPGVWVGFVCHYPHHPFGGRQAAGGFPPGEPWTSGAARDARRWRRQGERELRAIPELAENVPPAQAADSLAKMGAPGKARPEPREASTPKAKPHRRTPRARTAQATAGR